MTTVLHPNGFIQHDLEPGVRMHIWHPNTPRAQTVYTPIHDHAFDFVSQIICGELVHRTFFVTKAKKNSRRPGPNTAKFAVHAVKGDILVPTGEWVDVDEQHTMRFRAGDCYEYGGAGNFHASEMGVGRLTVTVIRKMGTWNNTPKVLVPKGWKPDNEFRRDQYSEEALLPFVEMGLEAMKSWQA